jgi:hypothetical protein
MPEGRGKIDKISRQIWEGALNQSNHATLRQVQPLLANQSTLNVLNNTIPNGFELIRSSKRKIKILKRQGRHLATHVACHIFYNINITDMD